MSGVNVPIIWSQSNITIGRNNHPAINPTPRIVSHTARTRTAVLALMIPKLSVSMVFPANAFAGLKAYIDYDPWLTSAPRMLPVSEDLEELPMTMKLTSESPNPSSGSAELHFWMPGDGNLELRVYGLDGRLVRVLYNGQTAAGTGSVIWDGDDRLSKPCPSGVYLIHMKSRFGTDTARFVLVK